LTAHDVSQESLIRENLGDRLQPVVSLKVANSCLHVFALTLRDGIGSMSDSLLDRHRTEILALAARRGASNVRVFGSAARGESRPDSDVDLLVSFEAGRSLLDAIGFKHDVEDLIHRPVDVVTERALSPYLRESVLTDAVPL